MSTQGSVFISYSHKDREFVHQLSEDLRNEGFDLWIDIEQISAGVNWQRTIAEGLKASKVLIFVASKHSAESSWMVHEVTTFLSAGNTVIPIIIDETGYDIYENLSTARIRIYSDPSSVGTSNNVITTYRLTSVSTETGKFTTWKQIEE